MTILVAKSGSASSTRCCSTGTEGQGTGHAKAVNRLMKELNAIGQQIHKTCICRCVLGMENSS